MITVNSAIKDLLIDPRIEGLQPQSLKAYLYFLEKADENRLILNFSKRSQSLEWQSLDFKVNKNNINNILEELISSKLIKMVNKNSLRIL